MPLHAFGSSCKITHIWYLARWFHLTVCKEEAQSCPWAHLLLLSHLPLQVCVHTSAHTHTCTHTVTHTHMHIAPSLPNAHTSFLLLFLSHGQSLKHSHAHAHTDTHRHTIPVVSPSSEIW